MSTLVGGGTDVMLKSWNCKIVLIRRKFSSVAGRVASFLQHVC